MPPSLLVETLLRPWLRARPHGPFRLPGAIVPGEPVLVLDPGDTAELAFHAGLLRAAREACGEAPFEILLPAKHAPLVAGTGLATGCLVYEPRQLRPLSPGFVALLRTARSRPWQAAILTSQRPQPALELALRATGAPLRLGPSHAGAWPAVSLEVRRPEGDDTYRGDRPAALLPLLGLPAPAGPAWRLPADRLRQARQLVRFNKPRPDDLLVAVDPSPGRAGAAFAPAFWRQALAPLAGAHPCQFLPVGAEGGEAQAAELAALLPAVAPALPRRDLLDVALLLACCDLFVGGNTDLFHLAVSLGVPCVGLFAPADGPDWEPRGRAAARVVRVEPGGRRDGEALLAAAAAAGVRRPRAQVRYAAEAAAGGADGPAVSPGAPGAG